MEEKILEMLEKICGDEIVKEDREINLIEEDLIDSLDYVELLVLIENEFNVVMSPSEFKREEMDTPNKIIAQVKARL